MNQDAQTDLDLALVAYLNAVNEEAKLAPLEVDICPEHSARKHGFVVHRSGPDAAGASAGAADPPVLFFCPGMHGDDLAFFPLRRLLDKEFIVYSVRYRHTAPHTGEQYTADVAEAIERLGITRFSILGESMGSIPSFQVAAQMPDRVQSLTLAGGFTHCVHRILTIAGRLLIPIIPVALIKFAGRTILPRSVLRTNKHFPAHVVASYQALFSRDYLKIICARIRMIERWDFRDRLKELKIPVMYYGGTHDVLVPVHREVKVLERAFPKCRCVIIPKLPHPLLLTHPEKSAEILSTFLHEINADRINEDEQ